MTDRHLPVGFAVVSTHPACARVLSSRSLRDTHAARSCTHLEIMRCMRLFVLIALAGGVGVMAADPPTAEISNGKVSATIYLPDPVNGFYRGTRFDWSGVVRSLEANGHRYYGPWFTRR